MVNGMQIHTQKKSAHHRNHPLRMEVSQNKLGSAHNLTQIRNEIYEFISFCFYQIVDASLVFMTSNRHVYCFLKTSISKCPSNGNGKSNM